jgi:hypothetical protein
MFELIKRVGGDWGGKVKNDKNQLFRKQEWNKKILKR